MIILVPSTIAVNLPLIVAGVISLLPTLLLALNDLADFASWIWSTTVTIPQFHGVDTTSSPWDIAFQLETASDACLILSYWLPWVPIFLELAAALQYLAMQVSSSIVVSHVTCRKWKISRSPSQSPR